MHTHIQTAAAYNITRILSVGVLCDFTKAFGMGKSGQASLRHCQKQHSDVLIADA